MLLFFTQKLGHKLTGGQILSMGACFFILLFFCSMEPLICNLYYKNKNPEINETNG